MNEAPSAANILSFSIFCNILLPVYSAKMLSNNPAPNSAPKKTMKKTQLLIIYLFVNFFLK